MGVRSILTSHYGRLHSLSDSLMSFVINEKNDPNSTFNPDQLMGYIYAIFFSPQYRIRYKQFLDVEFPRVPCPNAKGFFQTVARLGVELISLHLFESPTCSERATTLIRSGSFQIEKVSYSDETIWISKAKTSGFKGVPEDIWNFHIGGYQVCHKWLKDRGPKKGQQGRILTKEDIDHYQKIIVTISETIRIMAEIDEVIEEHGGWPGAFVTE